MCSTLIVIPCPVTYLQLIIQTRLHYIYSIYIRHAGFVLSVGFSSSFFVPFWYNDQLAVCYSRTLAISLSTEHFYFQELTLSYRKDCTPETGDRQVLYIFCFLSCFFVSFWYNDQFTICFNRPLAVRPS